MKIPPAKRNQLIMVILATLCLLAGIYFFLIQTEKQQNINLAHQTNEKQAELERIIKSVNDTKITDQNLTDVTAQLQHAEEDIAAGDVFTWIFDTIRKFKANYHVDIPNIGQPVLGDVDMIQGVPYKQIRVSLSGTAYYHDLGKFISDFENTFPHMRMANLSIEPNNGPGAAGGTEKLIFRVDVIALVKPNS